LPEIQDCEMTAIERAARNVIAAAWRWNVGRNQDARTRKLTEDLLEKCVEAHGDAVKRSLARKMSKSL